MKISFIKMCRQFLKVGSGGEGYNEWWLDVENVSITSNNATTYNAWSFNPPKVEHNFLRKAIHEVQIIKQGLK